jgi:putative colanic acid biosynthesis UDP-glucose lipid carrier transferase
MLLERWANGLAYALIVVGSLFQMLLLTSEPFGLPYRALALVVGVWAVLAGRRFPFATPWAPGRPGSVGTRMYGSWAVMIGTLLLAAFLLGVSASFSRLPILLWILVTPVLLLAANRVVIWLSPRLLGSMRKKKTAVLVSINDSARLLCRNLQESGAYELVGYFDMRRRDAPDGLAYLGAVGSLPHYVRDHRIEVVFVVLSEEAGAQSDDVVDELRDAGVQVYFVLDFLTLNLFSAQVRDVEGVPVIEVRESPVYGVDGVYKRVTDLLVSSLALILLALPMLAVVLWIRIGSRDPAIVHQRRYDLGGRRFQIYRFRGLPTADDVGLQGPGGELLRRFGVADWPQLFSVLRGDLSLVGPRAHTVAHNEFYRRAVQRHLVRRRMRPGLTGWAQVNGLRSDASQIERMEDRVQYDLEYIRYWSPLMDLKILWRTVAGVFRNREN